MFPGRRARTRLRWIGAAADPETDWQTSPLFPLSIAWRGGLGREVLRAPRPHPRSPSPSDGEGARGRGRRLLPAPNYHSKPGLDSAGAHDAQPAESFVERENSQNHQQAAGPPGISRENQTSDYFQPAENGPRNTPAPVNVSTEKLVRPFCHRAYSIDQAARVFSLSSSGGEGWGLSRHSVPATAEEEAVRIEISASQFYRALGKTARPA